MKVVLGVSLCVTFLKACHAHFDEAYMRNPDDGFTIKNNWMSNIRGDTQLSEIAFPGTHGSASFDGNPPTRKEIEDFIQDVPYPISEIVKVIKKDVITTQGIDFKKQLQYGIRVFDIRLLYTANQFALMQGGSFLYYLFEDFLEDIIDFLHENPSETILFTLILEKQKGDNKKPPGDKLGEYLSDPLIAQYFLKTNNTYIRLKDTRGKFIILSREQAFNDYGLNFYGEQFSVMDKEYLGTNWDLYDQKWEPVKGHLKKAIFGDKNIFYVNFLSGYGGSFPYFVASGHSSHFTSAHRLATGLTTPGWKGTYPDFPRVNCFIGICTIAFEGINILTRDKILSYNEDIQSQKRTVGIIMADFPGDSLIKTIIENNALLENYA